MDKKTRIGRDPLSWIKNTKKKKGKENKTVRKKTSKPAIQENRIKVSQEGVKVTYYIEPDVARELKVMSVKKGMRLSKLVCDVLKEFVKQQRIKTAKK